MSIYHTHLSRYSDITCICTCTSRLSQTFAENNEYSCEINDYAYLDNNINNNYCRD